MSLHLGTTLGPYQVTAKIGEGGMGEVYRARDTKLDRDVALKVLPQAFTDDPDRLARFEREAKVLASLNHPNIGSIYGLERRQLLCSDMTEADNGRLQCPQHALKCVRTHSAEPQAASRWSRSSRPVRTREKAFARFGRCKALHSDQANLEALQTSRDRARPVSSWNHLSRRRPLEFDKVRRPG